MGIEVIIQTSMDLEQNIYIYIYSRDRVLSCCIVFKGATNCAGDTNKPFFNPRKLKLLYATKLKFSPIIFIQQRTYIYI